MCLNPDNLYVFIVDTDSYSGNFNRELCAYMTGIDGHHNMFGVCRSL